MQGRTATLHFETLRYRFKGKQTLAAIKDAEAWCRGGGAHAKVRVFAAMNEWAELCHLFAKTLSSLKLSTNWSTAFNSERPACWNNGCFCTTSTKNGRAALWAWKCAACCGNSEIDVDRNEIKLTFFAPASLQLNWKEKVTTSCSSDSGGNRGCGTLKQTIKFTDCDKCTRVIERLCFVVEHKSYFGQSECLRQ